MSRLTTALLLILLPQIAWAQSGVMPPNTVWAGPPAGTTPGFGAPRTLVPNDMTGAGAPMIGDCTLALIGGNAVITCIQTAGVTFAPSATTDTTNASNISNGTLSAARLAANGITNAILAQMPASTIKCNPTAATANAQDCPGGSTGFAEMRPFPSQGAGAWNVVDPLGNAISTAGTTCQGLDKLVAAAGANGWSWRVVGSGTISCTAPIVLPTCFLKSELIDAGVTIAFTAQGASNLMTMNSHENCQTSFRGSVTQNSADTGAVVTLAPTTNDSSGNTVFAASTIEIASISPGTAGIGVKLDPTVGGFIGNSISIYDVNGGATGIQVLNPGSGVIAFEQNRFSFVYNHGQTTRVVQIGTSTTNAGNMRYNTWFPGRVDPGAGATVAWDTWARNDTYIGLAIDNETANATTGLKLESGANNNVFVGGIVQATTPLSDAGLGNLFVNVSGVANAATFALLPACAAAFEGMTKGVTDSSTATWGATITGSGANHVQAYCNGTNWTVGAK